MLNDGWFISDISRELKDAHELSSCKGSARLSGDASEPGLIHRLARIIEHKAASAGLVTDYETEVSGRLERGCSWAAAGETGQPDLTSEATSHQASKPDHIKHGSS